MIRHALREQVHRAASDLGFDAVVDLLLGEARECVHILNDESVDRPPIGTSRLGGLPDLPDWVDWPLADTPDLPGHVSWPGIDEHVRPARYADFLAQLALADVPAFEDSPLPKSSHLWLFVTGWREYGEIGVAVVRDREAGTLRRRAAPADKVPGLVDRWSCLRFEVGVSLPFGRTAFREAICNAPNGQVLSWNDLVNALEPSGCVGQIGGFAFSYEGHDLRRDMVLAQLGRRELIAEDQYDSIHELEESAEHIPPYIRSNEERSLWLASYEKLRPQVEWIERHQSEIRAWELLMRLDSNSEAGFWLGDAYPLWVFARPRDIGAGLLKNVVAVASA